jgi:hypothetical protein
MQRKAPMDDARLIAGPATPVVVTSIRLLSPKKRATYSFAGR